MKHMLLLFLQARNVVKELRTRNNILLVKKKNLKKPFLDCLTRWNFMHDMLKRLLLLKPLCQEVEIYNRKLYFSLETWTKVEEIVTCLEPAKKATIKLQREDITLTDVYKYLNICHIATAEIGGIFT